MAISPENVFLRLSSQVFYFIFLILLNQHKWDVAHVEPQDLRSKDAKATEAVVLVDATE